MADMSTRGLPFGPDEVTMVESSNILGFALGQLDADEKRAVWVIFNSGAVYEYPDVERLVSEDFVEATAASAGSAFYRFLRARHAVKIGNVFEGGVDDGD